MITLEQVQAEAANVVRQFGPDHVNPGVLEGDGCLYTNEDGEHCVAAQITVNLGASVPEYLDANNSEAIDKIDWYTDIFTPEAIEYLVNVQRSADNGDTWADSVAKASTLFTP